MHAYSQYLFILFLSNSIVHLLAQEYTSIPRRQDLMNAVLLHTFELRCQYNGVGDGEFLEWFKKNGTHDVSVNTDKPGHYVVKQNELESQLMIKIFGKRREISNYVLLCFFQSNRMQLLNNGM